MGFVVPSEDEIDDGGTGDAVLSYKKQLIAGGFGEGHDGLPGIRLGQSTARRAEVCRSVLASRNSAQSELRPGSSAATCDRCDGPCNRLSLGAGPSPRGVLP